MKYLFDNLPNLIKLLPGEWQTLLTLLCSLDVKKPAENQTTLLAPHSMALKRDRAIQWLSLLAALLILVQISFIFLKGESFCLNQGCRVVEQLTTIPPLYINLAGLFYFVVLFGISGRHRKRVSQGIDQPRLLLLGLAVEAVLLSYQFFIIGDFCSYCLVILAIIVILNLLCGWLQIRLAIPMFAAVLGAFAVLNFSPASLLALRSESLATGTFAVKKCEVPNEKLYFFFSADCPHCKNVLAVLENCNSCEFHFNPIDKKQSLAIPGLELTPSYSPDLNRVILSMLNIKTIPVLLWQSQDGLTFIKGEEAIINFISRTCFREKPAISSDAALIEELEGTNLFNEPEGECAIEVECPDEAEQLQSPLIGR